MQEDDGRHGQMGRKGAREDIEIRRNIREEGDKKEEKLYVVR